MKWSFQIARVQGIQIRVHVTFVLVVVWGAFNYGSGGGLRGLAFGALLTLLVFGIVLLHELGHSLAALRFGIAVRDITLLPIGGVARLERMPQKPVQELVVAVAGPLVNVVLALLSIPVLWHLTGGYPLAILFAGPLRANFSGLFVFLFIINLSLLIFNLIPAFPLDGGRIFRALLATGLGFGRATRLAVWVGQGLAFLMGLYGLWRGNWLLAFVALFIFSAGSAEGRSMAVRSVLDSIRVREALSNMHTVLHPGFTVIEVATMTLHNPQTNFPVMLGDVLIGIIGRHDIRRALAEGQKWATVAEVMRRDFPTLRPDATLTDAQDTMFQANSPVAAVYEGTRLCGLLSFEDIERAFQMFPLGKGATVVSGASGSPG
ncbi:MAG: CBS domain-containing protein [Caldilineae bacterium]|nr:MAG: CBS domain-containing protein [Caldilineae bacterium]